LRCTRRIGDFTRWKEHVAYSKSLERLLRDLKAAAAAAANPLPHNGRLCEIRLIPPAGRGATRRKRRGGRSRPERSTWKIVAVALLAAVSRAGPPAGRDGRREGQGLVQRRCHVNEGSSAVGAIRLSAQA
jgi:hypothetical protein